MNLSKPPPIKKSKLASDDGSNSGINEESELIKKLEEENRKMFEMISMSNERL